LRSGDARVLGELVDVAVRGAKAHPAVAAVVDPGLVEDLHAGGPKLGGRVWMSSTRNPATSPVVKWRLIALSGPKTSALPRPGRITPAPWTSDSSIDGSGAARSAVTTRTPARQGCSRTAPTIAVSLSGLKTP
jgi:hypothetical protein